jgi:hypothetical protein
VAFKDGAQRRLEDAILREGEDAVIRVDVDALVDFALDAYDRSAWEAFKFLDIVLALLALAVIALAIARLLGRAPDLPIAPGLLMAALGGLALLIVLIRIAFTPNLEIDAALAGQDGSAKVKDLPDLEVDRHFWGPFVAFLASLGAIAGGLLAAGGRRAVDAVRAGEVRGERPLPPIEPEPAAPQSAPMQPPPDEAPAAETGAVREPHEGGGDERPDEEERSEEEDEEQPRDAREERS